MMMLQGYAQKRGGEFVWIALSGALYYIYYKTVALVVQPTTSKTLRLQCYFGSSRFGEASLLGTGLKQALVREHP